MKKTLVTLLCILCAAFAFANGAGESAAASTVDTSDITADDLKEYETQAQELSAEELEEVNAGRSFCIAIGLGWGDTNYSFCRVLGLGLCG